MIHSEFFVIRVWYRVPGGFLAAVRRVDEEQTWHFSHPDDVVRFLTGTSAP